MKKKISVSATLIFILFAVLLTFQITYSFLEKEYQQKVDTLTKTQSDFSKLYQADLLIREHFLGSIEEDSLEENLLDGFLSSLNDPFCKYLSADEYSQYLEENNRIGTGIGARFTFNESTGEVIVYAVFPQSPAKESGLQKGDVLCKIDDKNVSELGFYGAVEALSGSAGTNVCVSVKRKLATQVLEMDFTMTRKELTCTTVNFEMLENNVGYIQIFDIAGGTAQEFSNAVFTLTSEGAQALIFDVRNSTGNSLEEVTSMLDLLLPEGVILRTCDKTGKEVKITSDKECILLPMRVVMNSATAGVTEAFAATLRDFGAATLVGETTYGKGKLQTVLEMDDGSAIILSNLSILPASSPDFQSVGVAPDLECKSTSSNIYLTCPADDQQLLEAVSSLWE